MVYCGRWVSATIRTAKDMELELGCESSRSEFVRQLHFGNNGVSTLQIREKGMLLRSRGAA